MKPRKKPVTDPLDKNTYSLREKRHCSCGRDEAEKEVFRLRMIEKLWRKNGG